MARVLVADDDAVARGLVARALRADGHEVEVVTDGSAALDRVRSGSRYDVLVTDVEMPGVDGLALARGPSRSTRILRSSSSPGLPMRSSGRRD